MTAHPEGPGVREAAGAKAAGARRSAQDARAKPSWAGPCLSFLLSDPASSGP